MLGLAAAVVVVLAAASTLPQSLAVPVTVYSSSFEGAGDGPGMCAQGP